MIVAVIMIIMCFGCLQHIEDASHALQPRLSRTVSLEITQKYSHFTQVAWDLPSIPAMYFQTIHNLTQGRLSCVQQEMAEHVSSSLLVSSAWHCHRTHLLLRTSLQAVTEVTEVTEQVGSLSLLYWH